MGSDASDSVLQTIEVGRLFTSGAFDGCRSTRISGFGVKGKIDELFKKAEKNHYHKRNLRLVLYQQRFKRK